MISLDFPPNLELKVLIQYVGDRLGINFIYDEQDVSQRITIVSPAQISKDSLLGLLESSLKMKGLVVVDGDQPGWRKIVPASDLKSFGSPTTQPAQGAPPAVAVTQIFTLRFADPQRADGVIKPFLTPSGGNSIPLPEQHLLIVTDYASTVQRVAELIGLLDRPPESVATRFVPVLNMDVAMLVPQLQQILEAREKSQAGPGNNPPQEVQIMQDSRTNQLILVGPPDKVASAVETAASLDVGLPLQTRVYNLRSLAPDRLDRLVRETIDPLDLKRLYQSSIEKDSGMLIVTTTPAIHQKIADLQSQLDVSVSEAASPIRFYKLTNTTAADVLATIRALEGGQETQNGSEGEGSVSPAASQGTNSAPASPSDSGITSPNYHDNLPSASPGVVSSPNLSENISPSTGSLSPPDENSALQPLMGVHTANAKITADPNTNTIIVEADASTQRLYAGLIKALDKRRPQVLLECTIVTIDSSYSRSFGVELGAATVGQPKIVTFNSFGLSTPDPSTGVLTLTPGPGFNGTLVGSQVAQVVVQALQTDSRARVLSAPRILVNDNATGTLSSVDEQPFTSVNASTTVATTSFAGYASAGTTITLTPHISESEHLQLEYVVTQNSFSGESSNGVPPPRQTDTVQSKITIPDGSTVIVGGLNSNNESLSRQTVPWLGDIPILKYLVSQQSHTKGTSTLFVFIKPTILRDDQFADLKFFSDRDAKDAGLQPDFPQSEPLLIR
jgi:general secretion pathway protein D